ncbi:hypothetical protein MMC15_000478 [Xylographa vitiligo]|nr:hypothetical protein [Xylographa vitiligo]
MARNSSLAPSPEQAKHWAKRHRTMIAASTSTLLATAVSHPIDTVKMQMQIGAGNPFVRSVREMYNTGGIRIFYKGSWLNLRKTISIVCFFLYLLTEAKPALSSGPHTTILVTVPLIYMRFFAPLATYTLVRTANFEVYQRAKYAFSSAIGTATGKEAPLVTVNRPGSTPTPATVLCFGAAGGLAGCLTTFLACPFELMKNTAQVGHEMAKKDPTRAFNTVGQKYAGKGTIKIAKEIITQHGLLGLWKGVRLHMVRDTIGTSVYFMSYESLKQLIVKYQGSSSPTSPTAVAIAGGACGIISWLTTYNIDYVKNNYQRNCLETAKGEKVMMPKINYYDRKQLRGIPFLLYQYFRSIMADHYKGLSVTLFRSCLTNAVLFSSFEYVKTRINNLDDPITD